MKMPNALQVFEPVADSVYTIETTAHLVDLPRRRIALYYKHGLVSPAADPAKSGYCFDRRGIDTLRRIASLRAICGDDLPGIKMILDLTNELEGLQSEMRSLRDGIGDA
jgi:MerR family transcriptional regulator/heat shock protein HspR